MAVETLRQFAELTHGEDTWVDEQLLDKHGTCCAEMMKFISDDPVGYKAGEHGLLIYYSNGNRGWFVSRNCEVICLALHRGDER